MRYSLRSLLAVIPFAVSLLCTQSVVAQKVGTQFEFMAPLPDAAFIPPVTSIILRPGGTIETEPQQLAELIRVTGSSSGQHSGEVVIADDGETIAFTPHHPFAYSEQVIVYVREGIELKGRWATESLNYSFQTSREPRVAPQSILSEMSQGILSSNPREERTSNHFSVSEEKLLRLRHTAATDMFVPDDYPKFDLTLADGQGEGDIFIAPISFSGRGTPYLLILDSKGDPVFYRRLPFSVLDFKKQPTGELSYFNSGSGEYVVLDSTYNTVNTWKMKNGYLTDGHGLQLFPDGHALMMSYDAQPVDMSQIVPNGDPNAIVTGLVIQELDASKNVLFEWRSWDHFKITDAVGAISLTTHEIDYVHANALERDRDGHILLSSRHMDEITKINRQNGEIIWRLGGENNQFTFTNDTIPFTHQHDIRRLPNGNITLFDNGNNHSPLFSRAVEYQLDEANKTARLVWRYPMGDERYSFAMGSVQRLPNGNSMIGWGFPFAGDRKIVATEVNADGKIVFEIMMDTAIVSYRAFRFPWNGRSASPYLWIEDRDRTTSDTVLLKMTMFGRDDIVSYRLWRWDFPVPERLFDSTEGNTFVVRNLERGKSYLFRAVGVTDQGEETESSEWIRFTILPIGPIFTPPGTTFSIPLTKVGGTRSHTLADFFVNTGEEPLIIEELVLGGANQGDFSVGGGLKLPLSIQPGSSADLVIDFTPSEEGTRNGALTIRSNAVNDTSQLVRFVGTAAKASVAGTSVHFGRVQLGKSVDSVLTNIVRNIGSTPVVVSQLSAMPNDFTLSNLPPLPTTILPQDSLTLTVSFSPIDSGNREGTLRVVSDAEPSPLDVRLSGVGDDLGIVWSGELSSLQVIVSPIPSLERIVVSIISPTPGKGDISIVDMRGKVVRRISADLLQGEEKRILWDGTDSRGESVGSGNYIVRVVVGSEHRDESFLLVR
ncbi:MAG: aryl-sulfate sulfotransferase [Ignavibacteriae bacterium]|nr:aryl-sulfate sulfotransferase [Ignavibacteriota bacterium]MCB9217633.1 aryl-sulfate sulfotransferase [Ignavibacteria bacterium]